MIVAYPVKALLAFLLIFLTFSAARYTMDDLKVLEKEKDTREFLLHAKDIPPAQRGRLWEQMAIHMATEHLSTAQAQRLFDEKNFLLILEVLSWPVLRRAPSLGPEAREYFRAYFQDCFQKRPSQCSSKATGLWPRLPQSPEFGIFLAKLAKKKGASSKEIWPLIQQAPISVEANRYCQDRWLQGELIPRLVARAQSTENSLEIANAVQDLASSNCLQALWAPLKALAFRQRSYRGPVYRILKSFQAMTQKEEDLLFLTTLLQNPIHGGLFNRAWNRFRDLGGDFPQRMAIIHSLKGQLAKGLPLPDDIFTLHSQQKKAQVVAQHLEKYFPEFWPLYFQTCYEFYSGKKEFPHGPLTPSCLKAMGALKNDYLYARKVNQILRK